MVDEIPSKEFHSDTVLAACVAQSYYLERRSKQDIAAEQGISRFKVARLIDLAHELGLVMIDVVVPVERDARLEQRLEQRFGLDEAIVARDADALGHAAAHHLAKTLKRGDVLGVAWGSSVRSTVSELAGMSMAKPVEVVQLSGGFQTLAPDANSVHVAAEAARIFDGELHALHVPAFVDSRRTRDMLIRQPSIADTFQAMERLTVALFGIGSIGSMSRSDSVFSRALEQATGLTLSDLRARGAIGDISGQVFDGHGSPVRPVSDYTVAIPADLLDQVPRRVAVAAGEAKIAAITAAADAGKTTELITDVATARALVHPSAVKAG